MRAFRWHLRNSPVRWFLPALIVLDVAILFLRTRYWIGIWPETGAAAQTPAYVLSPIVAGAAAWAATARSRHRVTEQVQAAQVPPVVQEGYQLAATLVVLLVPYLVGQIIGGAFTAASHPPGFRLWIGYFFLGLFVEMLTVCLGWLVGKLFTATFAALTAALGCLLGFALLDMSGDFMVVSGHPESAVATGPLVLRLALTLTALALALRIPLSDTAKPRSLALPALAIVAVLGVVISTKIVVDRKPAGEKVICVNGSVALCIWPEHRKYLSMLEAIDGRVAALPDAFVIPPRMDEFGIEQTSYTDDDGVVRSVEDPKLAPIFYILEGSVWAPAGGVSDAIAAATFPFYDDSICSGPPTTKAELARLDALRAWMEAYLAGGGQPDYHTDAPADMQKAWAVGRAMTSAPKAQQFAWAAGEVRDLLGRYCSR